jgi:hypothetical protein
LNHTVLFLKQSDVILTSDVWRVVLDVDLRTYHDIVSTIKSDLMSVESQKQEFIPVNELQQIKTLLETLDSKLNDFHQGLP